MRVTSKQAGLFAADASDRIRSADIARCDWLHDTDEGAKLFRRAGEQHIGALVQAVYNSFGVDITGPAAKRALRKVKGNRKRLSAKVRADLNEFERVAKSVQRAKDQAFPKAKAARKAGKAKAKGFRVTKAVATLVASIKALGYGVKLTHGPAK